MQARSRVLLVLGLAAISGVALAAFGPGLSGLGLGGPGERVPSGPEPAPLASPARAELHPLGRTVLPASDCLAPARLATDGPSPRCVIPFGRAPAAMGFSPSGGEMVISLTHAATASWFLPQATLARPFDPLPPETEARAILLREGPNVALFAVGSRLLWYDADSGGLLETREGPGGTIRDLAWARTGSPLLAATSGDGRAHLLDGEGNGLRSFRTEGQVLLVAMDREGRRAAVANDVGAIALFDLEREEEAAQQVVTPSLQPAAALAFASDRLLAAGSDGMLRAIDPASGVETARVDTSSPLVALAVSPDGRQAATAGRDRVIRLHALPSCAVVRALTWHEAGVPFLGFGAGPTLVSADNDGNLAIWDAAALAR